jgi:hypothetical protein
MKRLSFIAILLVCANQGVAAFSLPAIQNSRNANLQPRFNALHRLDFRILGTSCPVCLMGIQRRVKAIPGTIETAVMLKKPYGVSIIYDSKAVSGQKLLATVTLSEPRIKLLDIKDEPIDKVPLVLIPPHNETNSNPSSILPANH